MLALVKKMPTITYADALKFAKQNASEIFRNSESGLTRKDKLERLQDKYEQEAKAESRRRNTIVTAVSLIQERIDQLTILLDRYYPKGEEDPAALQKELKELKKLLKSYDEDILSLEKITESQAITNDAFAIRANMLFVNSHLGKFNQYLNKDTNSIFRVAILHPNIGEIKTGADLIYEQYDIDQQKVRIAAIQYKIWEDGQLYFSHPKNLEDQIDKLMTCFCNTKLCCDKYGDNVSKELYRLPFCAAFLRPTDKLQDPQKLITSGYHVPICKIDALKKESNKIEADTIKYFSLRAHSFEELFNVNMVGSEWMDVSELEQFYATSNILEPKGKITFYAQNAPRGKSII